MYQLTIKNPKKEIFQTVFYNEVDAMLFIKKQGIDLEDKEFLDEYYPIHKYVKTFGYLSHKSASNGYSEISIRRISVQSVSVDFKKNHQSLVAILQKLIEGRNDLEIVEKLGCISLFIKSESKAFEIGMLHYDDKINFLGFRIAGVDNHKKEFYLFQTFMNLYKMKKKCFDKKIEA